MICLTLESNFSDNFTLEIIEICERRLPLTYSNHRRGVQKDIKLLIAEISTKNEVIQLLLFGIDPGINSQINSAK